MPNLADTLKQLALEAGGPGSGRYYHVTHTYHVDDIKKEGIKSRQTSNWVTAKDKKRYGQGEVNALANPPNAPLRR